MKVSGRDSVDVGRATGSRARAIHITTCLFRMRTYLNRSFRLNSSSVRVFFPGDHENSSSHPVDIGMYLWNV